MAAGTRLVQRHAIGGSTSLAGDREAIKSGKLRVGRKEDDGRLRHGMYMDDYAWCSGAGTGTLKEGTYNTARAIPSGIKFLPEGTWHMHASAM